MASADCILLSSSPAQHRGGNAIAVLPSPSSPFSPDFPSLKALLSQKSQLSADSPAAKYAIESLTSSAYLVQDTSTDSMYADTIPTEADPKVAAVDIGVDRLPKEKVVRKPRADKDIGDDGKSELKKPRKPRAKKADAGTEEGTMKERPPRKPRAKRGSAEGQTKIPRGRITKPTTTSAGEKAARTKNTEAVSHYFATSISKTGGITGPSGNDLLLQEAVKRRVNWTPPRKTEACPILGIEDASNDLSSSVDKQPVFSSLLGNFGYGGKTDTSGSARMQKSIGMRKRKLIELILISDSAPAQPTPKPKAPVKKKRTITELAISAYANKVEETTEPAPLLQYLSSRNSTGDSGVIDGFKVPPKSQRSVTKTSAKNSKAKKTTAPAPILLSPESALKQVSKQDFVFGTSSQLARENSPTLLRDLHRVMKDSNQIDDPFGDVFGNSSPYKSTSGNRTTIGNSSRSLWSAASHGLDRETIEVEVVDMVESPNIARPCEGKPSTSVLIKVQDISQYLPSANDNEWLEVMEDDANHSGIAEPGPKVIDPVLPTSRLGLRCSSPRLGEKLPSEMKPKSPTKPPRSMKGTDEKPNFDGFSTAQLAKEIASYRFKPIKSRDQMIALLEKCWEGKQKAALANVEVNTSLPKSPIKSGHGDKASGAIVGVSSPKRPAVGPRKGSATNKSPKRPVGRPRKASTASSLPSKSQVKAAIPKGSEDPAIFPSVTTPLILRQTPKKQRKRRSPIPEEIDDSDVPLTPSPPRRLARHAGPSPLSLRLSPSPAPSPSSSIDDTSAQQRRLHAHITRAITTAPRSASATPPEPTWHEKILLFDPVVLEDLTAWLNTGALQRVGYDAEVAPGEVKQWCTAMGVCCCWRRENLSGDARKRF